MPTGSGLTPQRYGILKTLTVFHAHDEGVPHHLLLIEDDPDIAALLKDDLQTAGYHVQVALSVMQGLIAAREHRPALVLLDLGLPDGDGREVLLRLRSNTDIPVIVLTARDVVGEKVELLNLGADDYVVKPYHLNELLARIAVQLREDLRGLLSVGELELYPDRRLVQYQGKALYLSPKEFELLSTLMGQPGRVYSRQDLSDRLWKGELPEESNVVDVHMANLRSKLRSVEAYGLLRTVRGVGYALRA